MGKEDRKVLLKMITPTLPVHLTHARPGDRSRDKTGPNPWGAHNAQRLAGQRRRQGKDREGGGLGYKCG